MHINEFILHLINWETPTDPDAAYNSAEAILKAEWGTEYDARMDAARFAYQRLPTALQIGIDDAGLGNDPVLIRELAILGGTLR